MPNDPTPSMKRLQVLNPLPLPFARPGRRKGQRGIFLLGLAGLLSLMGLIVFMINASTLSSYQQAGRLRRRLAAQQLALGGLATAQARLGADPDWTGEMWIPSGEASGLGVVRIQKLPSAAESAWTIECEARAPANGNLAEIARLRAILHPSPGGAPAILDHFSWLPHPLSEAKKP